MIALYYQTKTPIDFYCRQKLNPKSFIQPSEILPVSNIRLPPFSKVMRLGKCEQDAKLQKEFWVGL